MKRPKLVPGLLFAVPLERSARLQEISGFIPGCIVEILDTGYLGSFFSKRIIQSVEELTPEFHFGSEDLLTVLYCSNLGILNDGWPIAGILSEYNSHWQMPEFAHIDPVNSGSFWARKYDFGAKDILIERPISQSEASNLWLDVGFCGHRAAQNRLTALYLRQGPADPIQPKGSIDL